MLTARTIGIVHTTLLMLLLGVSPAASLPDSAGSTNLVEPNGSVPICSQPCFTAEKSFEVYLAGNPSTPSGANCAPGDNTYIYQVAHLGGSGPFIPGLTSFELAVETSAVSSAGFISGFGIDPSSTTVSANDVVTWDFTSPLIGNGASSTKLVVCSSLLPGSITDTMASVDGQVSLDASGTCVGPLFEPAGQPLPCTIGFWKNRTDGKKGLLKFFPDGDFDAVVTQAVSLSGGLFANESALLTDLQSKGQRSMEERARQQTAAFLLNLAAGDLFPENSKCKLFDANQIDDNSCGSALSVSNATAVIFGGFAVGDHATAKDCADDTNNGIGVVGANSGE